MCLSGAHAARLCDSLWAAAETSSRCFPTQAKTYVGFDVVRGKRLERGRERGPAGVFVLPGHQTSTCALLAAKMRDLLRQRLFAFPLGEDNSAINTANPHRPQPDRLQYGNTGHPSAMVGASPSAGASAAAGGGTPEILRRRRDNIQRNAVRWNALGLPSNTAAGGAAASGAGSSSGTSGGGGSLLSGATASESRAGTGRGGARGGGDRSGSRALAPLSGLMKKWPGRREQIADLAGLIGEVRRGCRECEIRRSGLVRRWGVHLAGEW